MRAIRDMTISDEREGCEGVRGMTGAGRERRLGNVPANELVLRIVVFISKPKLQGDGIWGHTHLTTRQKGSQKQ